MKTLEDQRWEGLCLTEQTEEKSHQGPTGLTLSPFTLNFAFIVKLSATLREEKQNLLYTGQVISFSKSAFSSFSSA